MDNTKATRSSPVEANVERLPNRIPATRRRAKHGEEVMRMKQWTRAGVCAALLLSRGVSFAEGSSPPPSQTENANATSDAEFLARALRVNEIELTLGRMAAERGSTPDVKAMGAKMVQKHNELGWQLTDQTQRLGFHVAPELSADQRSTVDRLASLSGSAFDKSFKQTVDAGHLQERAMYRGEASHTLDPGLRDLTQRRVATLEQTVASGQVAKAKPKNDW
jgi:putative membrane protein